MSKEVTNTTPDQQEEMKKIANIAEMAINFILEYETSFSGTNAITRAHELMMWGHSMILNGAKKINKPKEGELMQNPEPNRIQTLN